ncbi:MAG: hypothetical protein N2484_12730 [Clostridia bacterium]|nr:hypothetical protein [Clostridia bacterium]
MKITFPHMGNLFIPLKVLFDILEIDYAVPSLSRCKFEEGIAHSPEFACLPFKITLGDLLDGIEQGADHILYGGGCGQCRFGYYADLHEAILKSAGYDVTMIRLDSSNMTFQELMGKLKPFTEGKSKARLVRGILSAVNTVLMADRLSKTAAWIRCREQQKGDTDKVMRRFNQRIIKAKGYKEIKQLIHSARKQLRSIPVDLEFKPLKVAIVGEIYTSIDPFVNMEMESKLGSLGVEVHNHLTISSWVIDHGIKKVLPLKLKNKAHERGKELFDTDDIGGHGLQTVGNAILSAQKGFDGVIHTYPFTCLPEIVAQCSFGEIQDQYGIPIMTLIIDELTGKAGYETRIEAFVDMLERRRQLELQKTMREAF